MSTEIRSTAFHARTSAANRSNGWETRDGVTLATVFTDTCDEVLAARTRVGLADLGARWQMAIDGSRPVEFLQLLLSRDVSLLAPSTATKALWLADGGGVRGAGVVARSGKQSFWLVAANSDPEWFAQAAQPFSAALRDLSRAQCGLSIVGPYARAVLEGAGIQANLDPLAFRKVFWRGLEVTLSRFGELGGFEIWCARDDAILVWDRLIRAGAGFGIEPLGLHAQDVLDVEAGVPRPGRDYRPAREGDAAQPHAIGLGLSSLVDTGHHAFNGRLRYLQQQDGERFRLVGLELDCDSPAPHASLTLNGEVVGRTLTSVYSPVLRRAIALAQVGEKLTRRGTTFSLAIPSSLDHPDMRPARAAVVDLPFVKAPDPLAA